MLVGTPVAFVVSGIGLFKDDKKLMAAGGLASSVLAGVAFFLGIFNVCP